MSKRLLYVGGLSDAPSDHQLRDLLGNYGVVARAFVVRHELSGKSAGYRFVETGSSEQAVRAVLAHEGALLERNCPRLCVTPYVSTNSYVRPIRQEETHR